MSTQIISAVILIDGVDQSSNVTAQIEIDLEASKARTSSFVLLPSTGLADLMSWVGSEVIIRTVVNSNDVLEFTGLIDSPNYDLKTGLTTFTCTDNLQEEFETKTKTEINALIPGAYWSEAVFNDSDGWEYAQERLSTIPSDLDMDESRVIRLTDWEAKTTPDFTFTESDIIDGSLAVSQITNRRNIINAVNIAFDYRYQRLKEREQLYSWTDGSSVCDIYLNPYPFPLKTHIQQVIESVGWEIMGDITYTDPPVDGVYPPCGVIFYQDTDFAWGVTFTLGKRYSQTITENYTIRVESQDSIDALGEIAINETASTETKHNTADWEASLIINGYGDFGTPSTDINNDNYINKDSATDRQIGIDTVVNVAKTKILESHRNNLIDFQLPINQTIDTIHTAQITTANLTAKGKVQRVLTTINTGTGEAITSVTIALSKPIGTGIPGTEEQPTPPDVLPATQDTQTVDLNLLSHIGGQDPTVHDPNWSGWVVDYSTITEPGHVPYPKGFVVHTPAIQTESIGAASGSGNGLIHVTIPDDTLS